MSERPPYESLRARLHAVLEANRAPELRAALACTMSDLLRHRAQADELEEAIHQAEREFERLAELEFADFVALGAMLDGAERDVLRGAFVVADEDGKYRSHHLVIAVA